MRGAHAMAPKNKGASAHTLRAIGPGAGASGAVLDAAWATHAHAVNGLFTPTVTRTIRPRPYCSCEQMWL